MYDKDIPFELRTGDDNEGQNQEGSLEPIKVKVLLKVTWLIRQMEIKNKI